LEPLTILVTTTPIASLSIVSSLSIASDGGPLGSRVYFGTLNLNNNDLIVHATNEATALATYAKVFDMVMSGFDQRNWLGTGITSGIVAADAPDGYESTAIGVILNDDCSGVNPDGSGNPISTSFDGHSGFSQYDVIVKYTFLGDTLLRGLIDSSDLTTVQIGRSNALTGWANGEFNYTRGPVTTLDVLETQRSLAYESKYPHSTPVPDPPPPLVPEPSSLILAVAGLGLVVGFRRLIR
jgi:hypothetical protein